MAQPMSETAQLGRAERSRDEVAELEAAVGQLPSIGDRYEQLDLLGLGGMGEVHAVRDKVIGRIVARKTLRAALDEPRNRRRFAREARIQGRLEHPSVVPVHDLGVDETGRAFFTMRRVQGRTLHQVLRALANGDRAMAERFGQHRLLSIFVQICRAVEFAHAHGIVHRDLKPSNVMVGDFGEVLVLDWGIAQVAGERTSGIEAVPRTFPTAASVEPFGDLRRETGSAVIGTLGYLSPEQARNDATRIGPPSDVYALGAILFEILTLRTLHEGHTPEELLRSTVQGVENRPSLRAPYRDVAPELEAICVRSTSLDPEQRFSSARALAEAVERYLEGDRDALRRRELAKVHVKTARRILDTLGDPYTDHAAFAEALRSLGRALAFDPHTEGAVALMGELMIRVPSQLPDEVRASMEQSAQEMRRQHIRYLLVRTFTWAAFVPAAIFIGVRRNWTGIAVIALVFGLMAASAVATRTKAPSSRITMALLLLSSLLFSMMTTVLGPFVLVPTLVATNTIFFMLFSERRERPLIIATGLLAVLLPFAVEVLRLVPPMVQFVDNTIVIVPRALNFPRREMTVVLALIHVFMMVTPALIAARVRDALVSAERRLSLQAWQLRHLAEIPRGSARPSATPEPPSPGSAEATATGLAMAATVLKPRAEGAEALPAANEAIARDSARTTAKPG